MPDAAGWSGSRVGHSGTRAGASRGSGLSGPTSASGSIWGSSECTSPRRYRARRSRRTYSCACTASSRNGEIDVLRGAELTWKLAAVAALVIATPLSAQKRPHLDVMPPAQNAWADDAPWVSSSGLLLDAAMRDLLANGFPARLHYRLERWVSGRWFDDLKAAVEWDVVLKYDVLGKKYQAVRVVDRKSQSLGEYAGVDDAANAVEAAYKVAIPLPKKGQRGYYNLLLDVETLSLTDLDEVQRWLRGELKPAVSGKKNPGTAVGRGIRTLVVRLLGGEKRHYEARTGTFRP